MVVSSEVIENDVVVMQDDGIPRILCTCVNNVVANELYDVIDIVGFDWVVPSIGSQLRAR